MNITGLNKAEVLAGLYNHSRAQGRSVMDPRAGTPMTPKDAQEVLDGGQTKFDYLKGRAMKINLGSDDVDTDFYNRDNGEGAAEGVIEKLVASHEAK